MGAVSSPLLGFVLEHPRITSERPTRPMRCEDGDSAWGVRIRRDRLLSTRVLLSHTNAGLNLLGAGQACTREHFFQWTATFAADSYSHRVQCSLFFASEMTWRIVLLCKRRRYGFGVRCRMSNTSTCCLNIIHMRSAKSNPNYLLLRKNILISHKPVCFLS